MTLQKIDASLLGCWIDGARGYIDTGNRVQEIAKQYGFKNPLIVDDNASESDLLMFDEAINDATEFLNSVAPEGLIFTWENGDLILVSIDNME